MIRILVPVDGSECALNAVRHAAFLVQEGSSSDVVLLNVQAPLERGRASAFHSFAELREHERRDGESALEAACEILDDSSVRYTAMIGLGNTAKTIVIAAKDTQCNSIVMGANLWSQIKASFGVGLPAKIIRKASVPVTIVKSSRAPPAAINVRLTQPRHDHVHPKLVDYASTY